jgi:hypothetical protein
VPGLLAQPAGEDDLTRSIPGLAGLGPGQAGWPVWTSIAGGVGYPRLALLHPLAARVPRKFTQNLGRGILSTSATVFLRKNGTIFWMGGCPLQ